MAAKLAQPDKQVLVIYGDGSFGLHAMEFEAALRQRIPFVGIIGNDGAWGQIKVAQELLYGPGNAPAAELDPQTPYEHVVEGLGGFGRRVDRPADIRPALRDAFDSGRRGLHQRGDRPDAHAPGLIPRIGETGMRVQMVILGRVCSPP